MFGVIQRPATVAAGCLLAAALALPTPAAQAVGASEASALSALPVAVSVGAPVVLAAGLSLTVVAVEVTAGAVYWVLRSASDGARLSLKISARAAEGLAVAAGTVLLCTALSTGWVLMAGSEVVAFVPNQIGASLLYNETVRP